MRNFPVHLAIFEKDLRILSFFSLQNPSSWPVWFLGAGGPGSGPNPTPPPDSSLARSRPRCNRFQQTLLLRVDYSSCVESRIRGAVLGHDSNQGRPPLDRPLLGWLADGGKKGRYSSGLPRLLPWPRTVPRMRDSKSDK